MFVKLNRTGFIPGEDLRLNADVSTCVPTASTHNYARKTIHSGKGMRICVSSLETNTSNSVHVSTLPFMLITVLIKMTDLSLGHITQYPTMYYFGVLWRPQS